MGLFKRRHKAPSISSQYEFDQIVSDGKPVLVDFMKYGCQPCQVMDGIVDEVSEEFDGEAHVVKARLEEVPELFGRFKIRSTPTFVLVTQRQGGLHQRWRHSGLVKKDILTATMQRAVEATT